MEWASKQHLTIQFIQFKGVFAQHCSLILPCFCNVLSLILPFFPTPFSPCISSWHTLNDYAEIKPLGVVLCWTKALLCIVDPRPTKVNSWVWHVQCRGGMFPQSRLHQLILAGYYLCKAYKATHSSETPFPPTRCLSRCRFTCFRRWKVVSVRKNNFALAPKSC